MEQTMTTENSSERSVRSTIGDLAQNAEHVDPTAEHCTAADRYLRGEPLAEPLATLLADIEPQLSWAQRGYITEARAKGPADEVWDRACWSVANSLARADGRL
jgi:hypothetical protein